MRRHLSPEEVALRYLNAAMARTACTDRRRMLEEMQRHIDAALDVLGPRIGYVEPVTITVRKLDENLWAAL